MTRAITIYQGTANHNEIHLPSLRITVVKDDKR